MDTVPPKSPPKDGRLKKTLIKLIPLAILVLAAGVIISVLNMKIQDKKQALAERQSHARKKEKALTNVVVMPILPGLVQERISFPGTTRPWIELDVVAEVRGKIISKSVSEGQTVKKGDVLAVIDMGDYRAARDSALASYESAQATHKRLTALVKKNFVTRSQLDDAVARVKTTRAALETARLNLSRCTILSPMNGIVDRVHIENGTWLNSGDPVIKILDMDTLKVEVGIPESDVAAVRQLKTFDLTIDALNGKHATGTFHYLYKTADAMARLYTLQIRLDNPARQVLPDMFVRVSIVKTTDPEGLAVPMYSLVSLEDLTGVFVEKDGQVRFQPVQTGFLDGWKVQIREGLAPGSRVVVVGHRLVEDGEMVHVARRISDMSELSQ